MTLPKIKFDKFGKSLGRIPRILAEKTFLTFIAFLILALIISAFIFYKDVFLIKRKQPEISEKPLQFKQDVLERILKKWEIRQKKFEEANSKQYPNPFQGPVPQGETNSGGLTQ